MQLKRLKRGAGLVNPSARHELPLQQDSMASQLLAELENLTEAPAQTQGNEDEGAEMSSHITPAGGQTRVTTTRRSRGISSSAKRQRRAQLVSVFGSQDENDGMQQQQQQLTSSNGRGPVSNTTRRPGSPPSVPALM